MQHPGRTITSVCLLVAIVLMEAMATEDHEPTLEHVEPAVAPTLHRHYVLHAEPGHYSIIGIDADLVKGKPGA